MEELYTKWKIMWDAKEYTTQAFFFANVVVALMIMSIPLRAGNEGTLVKRSLIFSLGLGYLILVIIGYLQLVPTVSHYGYG